MVKTLTGTRGRRKKNPVRRQPLSELQHDSTIATEIERATDVESNMGEEIRIGEDIRFCSTLQAHIHDSQDFTELVGFHQEYLSALISQPFLDIGFVWRILDSIMKLCLQFCWNIENQETNSSTSDLENLAEEFNKKSNSCTPY